MAQTQAKQVQAKQAQVQQMQEDIQEEIRQVGLRIRQARLNANLTTRAAGVHFGVSGTAIISMELNAGNLSLKHVLAASRIYDVSVDWLLNGEDA